MTDFDTWMKQVNIEIGKIIGFIGIDSDDLIDYPYRDAYEDEATPREVAEEVLEENGLNLTALY